MAQSLHFLDTYNLRKKKMRNRRKKRKKKRKRKTSDNEVESDLESTTRSEPKCKEMEDTYESDVQPKPDSS
ncbi:hypothetical protein Tco_0936827 [Tanacetum coccineum]|uniref:Uncharacterized protein n=1 Tax=Tanacetum coccineum TaxID=301880 RepID=A0ABQ5DF60_9ASTR